MVEQDAIRFEAERAIREKKQVSLSYRDEATRTVTPYGIKDGTLIALIEEGMRTRTYVLRYINQVTVIEGHENTPS
jgi:predicted DNA-binding transcriptional regulator YafY